MSVPVRWSWHHQRLQSLRDRLLAARDIHIAEASETLEPHSMDMADSATDEFDHDLALGLLSHEQDALFELDAAIRRIWEGNYGICEETGKVIPTARLRAVPWTRYSRQVKERLEQEGLVSGPHLGEIATIRDFAPTDLSEAEEPVFEELPTREAVRRRRQTDLEAIVSGGWMAAAASP